ncbi:unnamed protein product [Microthlaspi erraticum]|uniref:Uncharacterized protein n=1 Tax=Microthlaspi erraticum TaxID=1685480 RepID=A0A6D2JUF3_9BRAS|nr:unnamed protein product [Microthlaspi erraticum]
MTHGKEERAKVRRPVPHQLDRSRHCSSSSIDPFTATVARSIPLLQHQLDRSRHCKSSSIDPFTAAPADPDTATFD